MYKLKCISKSEGGYDDRTKKESCLDVNFNFWNEIAPRDRKEINSRINKFLKSVKIKSDTDDYSLKIPDKYLKSLFVYEGSAKKSFIGLGFLIYVWSNEKKSLEGLIDIDAIDRYILTGKEPESK